MDVNINFAKPLEMITDKLKGLFETFVSMLPNRAIKAIKQAFNENDITIPFPIRILDFGIKGGKKLSETKLVLDNAPNLFTQAIVSDVHKTTCWSIFSALSSFLVFLIIVGFPTAPTYCFVQSV
jgi:hypothetical protein